MTSIYKLKQSEYQTGAKLAFENFEDLLALSEKAAQLENFGAASSLCVLAIEELSKSVILRLKSINNAIPIKDLDKYFTSHEKKQNAGIAFFLAIQSEYKDDNNEEASSHDGSDSLLIVAIAVIAIFLTWYRSNKEEKSRERDRSYFDLVKESGFYVGYDKSIRQWTSPKSEHSRERFEVLFQYTNDFAEKIKNWIFCGELNKEKLVKLLYSLDDSIIDKKQLNRINKN